MELAWGGFGSGMAGHCVWDWVGISAGLGLFAMASGLGICFGTSLGFENLFGMALGLGFARHGCRFGILIVFGAISDSDLIWLGVGFGLIWHGVWVRGWFGVF